MFDLVVIGSYVCTHTWQSAVVCNISCHVHRFVVNVKILHTASKFSRSEREIIWNVRDSTQKQRPSQIQRSMRGRERDRQIDGQTGRGDVVHTCREYQCGYEFIHMQVCLFCVCLCVFVCMTYYVEGVQKSEAASENVSILFVLLYYRVS